MVNLRSQKGNIEFLILGVIIIGAFVLVGGQYIFDTLPKSNDLSSPPAKDGAGSNNGNGSENGGGNQGENEVSTPGWKISTISTSCDDAGKKAIVVIQFEGKADGYYSIGLTASDSAQKTFDFTQPNDTYDFQLPNSAGFNNENWQIKLFEGGSKSGEEFSGGTLRSSKNMSPTNCS